MSDELRCPYPAKGRPDDDTAAHCIAAGVCGCEYGVDTNTEQNARILRVLKEMFRTRSRIVAHVFSLRPEGRFDKALRS